MELLNYSYFDQRWKGESNGELRAKFLQDEVPWLVADAAFTFRAGVSIWQGADTLWSTVRPVFAALGTILVPCCQMASGIIMATSGLWMIKQTHQELAIQANILDQIPKTSSDRISIAQQHVFLSQLNVLNQYTFFFAGVGETVSGILFCLSNTLLQAKELIPLVLTFLGSVLGVIYIVRGGMMLGRALLYRNEIVEFRDSFRKQGKDWISKKKDELQNPEEASAYFRLRCGEEMAAKICKGEDYTLEELDKATHAEIFKQNVLALVGASSLLGGLGTLVALIFSCGTSAAIISIVTGGLSILGNAGMVPYDCVDLAKYLAERFYVAQNWDTRGS